MQTLVLLHGFLGQPSHFDSVRAFLGPFDPHTLAYPWSHPDPAVDRLHADVVSIVGSRLVTDRRAVFAEISRLAHERAGLPMPSFEAGEGTLIPYVNEPWYCCAEPNPEQLRIV